MSRTKARQHDDASDDMEKLGNVIDEMKQRADTGPFLMPVDWEAYGLFDYPQIITQPMDFGTVTKRLDAGEYLSYEDCVNDVRLIWTNCMTYNQDGSEFYLLAKKLSGIFEEKLTKAFPSANNTQEARPVLLSEKTKLSQDIYQISSEQLGEIVRMLQSRCKNALNRTGPDGLEINIDDIDAKTFREIESFISSCLGEDSNGSKTKSKAQDSELSSKSKKQRTQ